MSLVPPPGGHEPGPDVADQEVVGGGECQGGPHTAHQRPAVHTRVPHRLQPRRVAPGLARVGGGLHVLHCVTADVRKPRKILSSAGVPDLAGMCH